MVKAKCAPYLAARQTRRAGAALHNLGDYNIVAAYGAEYRGIIQFYQLARHVHRL